jgi:hypothetical protein
MAKRENEGKKERKQKRERKIKRKQFGVFDGYKI